MSDGIRGLLSRDGQVRRRTLDDLSRRLEYYIPPELRGTARFIGDMSPSAAHERATVAVRDLLAPDRTVGERLRSGADLALETMGIVAGPAVMGRYLQRPATEVSQELLTGFSVSPAARQADELLALPAPARDEVAPPPQQIDVPPTRPAEVDEYLDLWSRDWLDLSPEALSRRWELTEQVDTGVFDQFLPEADLRRSLREFLEDDAFGMLDNSPQTQQRFADLRARFPDEEARWLQEADEAAQAFALEQNLRPDPASRTLLPETAPAARVPGANPYAHELNDVLTQPQTWRDQGIAGLYSRSARAADRLQRREYQNPAELRRELEAFGASPKELDALGLENLEGFIFDSRVTRQEAQEFLRNAPGLQVRRTSKFAEHSPPGGRNYTSTTYHHPGATTDAPYFAAMEHFDSANGLPPLFHTRAAQYDLQFPDGGTTHHVVEIQSDWGQHRSKLPNQPLDENSMRVLELRNTARRLEEQIPGLRERGRDDAAREIQENAARLRRDADSLIGTNPRAEFDAQYPAPYVKNENDWVDAGVRQNLTDAVNSGSDWITFGNGAQAHRHIGMPEEAAKKFYDTRVPKRIEQVLKKFAREAQIPVPRLEDVPFVDGETVKGLRLTPELREAIIGTGFQSFREGGMVNGLAPLSRAETIEAYTPTLRDRARGGIQSLVGALGGSPGYASQVARDMAGTPESFGVLDITPVGVPFAAQEGTRAAVRGARAGDPVAAGMGAGEALLAVTPFGPAARTARTMAPSGTGRGAKPPQVSDPRPTEQVKPDVSRRDKELDYKFTREFDPVTGKQKTVIQPRTSGMQEGATARQLARQKKAAPVEGGVVEGEARYVRDTATGRLLFVPPKTTATTKGRLSRAETTPTEFRVVRAPLGGEPVSTPPPQRTVEHSSRGRQLDQAASGRFTPAKAGKGRRVSPEQAAGDPSHEWLEVPAAALNKLGFNPNHFTDPASRMSPDGRVAYLAAGPDTKRFLQGWRSQAEFFGLPKQPTLKSPTALPDSSVFSYPPTAAPVAPRADRGPGIVRSEGPPRKSRWFE